MPTITPPVAAHNPAAMLRRMGLAVARRTPDDAMGPSLVEAVGRGTLSDLLEGLARHMSAVWHLATLRALRGASEVMQRHPIAPCAVAATNRGVVVRLRDKLYRQGKFKP